ncbi:MAG: F0F1 ATP synthase subunit epsilon [Candidatus Magasanikbacteria bacterium]|nr:F0F1 ATP synthase subunit epsilon [Candidatus Magasanikbacteria bacterium]
MKFQIVTPERVVLSDEIDQITLTTEDGEITVLPRHIPLVTNLKPGELHYKKSGEDFGVAISGGFGVVKDDGSVVVLADTAEHAHEIDLVRAEEARARAAKLMSEPRKQEDVNFAALQMQLEKALIRLKVGNKYRKLK